ncbi:MAG: hypothetical protein ACRYGR_05775, partial [Janthinobacterium lividum]
MRRTSCVPVLTGHAGQPAIDAPSFKHGLPHSANNTVQYHYMLRRRTNRLWRLEQGSKVALTFLCDTTAGRGLVGSRSCFRLCVTRLRTREEKSPELHASSHPWSSRGTPHTSHHATHESHYIPTCSRCHPP